MIELFNAAQVGREVGLSRQRIFQLAAAGRIVPSYVATDTGRVFFDAEDVARFKERRGAERRRRERAA